MKGMAEVGDEYQCPPNHLEELKKLNKDYTFGKILGTGKYGLVCSGTMGTSNGKEEVAVKIIDLMKTSQDYRTKFLPKELWALEEFKHSYIVKVHDIKLIKNTFYIFMEKAFGGDILNMLEDKAFSNGIPESRTKSLYRMMTSGLKFIHDKSSAHRDIKCENVLLMNKERTIAKITDFGFSTTCFVPKSNLKILRDTYCGTPGYSAPEIEQHQPYDAMKADVWSLGIVFCTMLQNEMPFTQSEITRFATDPKKYKLEFKNKTLSKDCKDLITKQLELDPKKRLTIDKVMEHQWLKESIKTVAPKT